MSQVTWRAPEELVQRVQSAAVQAGRSGASRPRGAGKGSGRPEGVPGGLGDQRAGVTLFADSSALVTRYADEPGRPELDAAGPVIVSQLARVEVPSAIWRKHRLGQLSAEDASLLVAAFEADYAGQVDNPPAYIVVLVSPAILGRAARFIGSHGLCGYAAVQLSCARTVAGVVPECRTFGCYDRLFPAELDRTAAGY